MELDRFDKQILEILTDEDVNLNELSERINLSVSSVHRRIKHLIESQVMGQLKREINFNKLFSPVICYKTACLFLAVVAFKDWDIHSVNIKTAYFYSNLDKEIYIE